MDLVEMMCGADPVSGVVRHPDVRIRLRGKSGGPDIARVDVHEVYPGRWSWGVHLPGYGRPPARRHGCLSDTEGSAVRLGLEEILWRVDSIGRAADVCSSDREISEIKSWAKDQMELTRHKI